jgi:hypothetical protein
MAQLVAYEIQTCLDGKWKISSIFDDKDLAVSQAKHIVATGRFSAVRVVQEAFDEKEQKTASRVVFRHSSSDANAEPRIEIQDKLARREREKRERAMSAAHADQAAPRSDWTFLWIGLKATLILVGGAGAYIALRLIEHS